MRKLGLICAFSLVLAVGGSVSGQSNDINFPTPLTEKQVEGVIKARPIGDSRLTTQYFVFGGEQGDIFINVQTKNMDADIDIFAVDGMRPLTKMVVFSDNPDSETGRLIYLRRAEKLLLRIQGRTPDDRPAAYKIKFAGSFVALKATADAVPEPVVSETTAGGVKVNSAGTIIAHPAKPTTTPSTQKPSATDTIAEAQPAPTKKPAAATQKPADTTRSPDSNRPVKPVVDPLASIRLNIEFKDGTTSNAPLSEIAKFSVDKGVLTVIRKNGSIERYKMTEVEKVTIQ